MGVFKWLLSPVAGPAYGTAWVAEQLLEEAERRYYDEGAIRQEMLELERWYEQGKLDEPTFEERSDSLLQRLLEAQARRREQGEDRSR